MQIFNVDAVAIHYASFVILQIHAIQSLFIFLFTILFLLKLYNDPHKHIP